MSYRDETGSLTGKDLYESIHQRLDQLGGKINRFIQSVIIHHDVVKEETAEFIVNPD
ncbi:MAG TPA: hypothetical protein PKC67_08700 [Kiritimatiellia bacterium]|nr:hypothetical protein [Kiritimatiellia bacterium]HMP34417.1 hypothetical protein [Kiritimatiellia bacterium]